MTHFEYINTFVSFLYAIMVGRVVVTLSGVTRARIDWTHVGWLLVLTMNMLQTWWLRWGSHDMEYNYLDYVVSIAHAFPLVFAVGVLTPSKEPESWSAWLQDHRVRFFSSYALFWLAIMFGNYHSGGNWTGATIPLAAAITGALVSNRYVQRGLLVYFIVMFSITAYFLFQESIGG